MSQHEEKTHGFTTGLTQTRLGPVPRWLIAIAIVMTLASWIALAFFAKSRVDIAKEPPVLMVQDMHTQPKFKEQQNNPLFADGRSMRPKIDGTVSRETPEADENFYLGFKKGPDGKPQFFADFPKQIAVNDKLIARGKERFGIYCSACHGLDGSGNGMVHQRATELRQGTWVPPSDLASAQVISRNVGHIYNTISVGIRNMPGYGGQITPDDRWAIVAYVRAVQLTRNPVSAFQGTSK